MLETKPPREQAGRDAITAFSSQFKAAGYAALEILDGGKVSVVYCDYHDDYVVKLVSGADQQFIFSQVKYKVKRNHQWKPLDLFGTPLKGKINFDAVKKSFGVKMFEHVRNFGDQCEDILLETNVHFHDQIETLCELVSKGDISYREMALYKNIRLAFVHHFCGGVFDSHVTCFYVEKFLSLLRLRPACTYLNEDDGDFELYAGKRIYQYSEVPLSEKEKEGIAKSLIELVRSKSVGRIHEKITVDELNKLAGIKLDDLLSILSISKKAYETLAAGGDDKAIRNTSILQRVLRDWGCSNESVVFCCEAKNKWDDWLRVNRHDLSPLDTNFLIDRLQRTIRVLKRSEEPFPQLKVEIESVFNSLNQDFKNRAITKEILFGGVMASIVRGEL